MKRHNSKYGIMIATQIIVMILFFFVVQQEQKPLQQWEYLEDTRPICIELYEEKDGEIVVASRELVNTVNLEKGSYEITVTYSTEKATTLNCLMQTVYGSDYADSVSLLTEMNQKTFDLMLYHDVTEFYLQVAEPTLDIQKIVVRETAQWHRMLYTILVFVIVVIDMYIYQKDKRWWSSLGVEKKTVILAVLAIGLFSSLPLFTNYLINGADLSFHLMRIEGIAEGLSNGTFPVKMQSLWINDYGYPVSIMYGDLLLYIPALLRLCGFTLQTVYKMYVVGINILTAATAYCCGKKISDNYKIGLLMSAVYTLTGYRLSSTIYRASIGEVTALAFFPIVVLGLWQVFQEENKDKLKQSALLLIVGYTGLLESHLLSFEMMILFSALYCVANWKLFVKRIPILVKTALVTIGLNLFYLVPFLEYMLKQNLHVVQRESENMQMYGLFIPQLFQSYAYEGDGYGFMAPVSKGTSGEFVMGAGIVFAIFIVLYVWMCMVHRKKLEEMYGEREYKNMRSVFWMMVIAAFMMTYIFPWETLRNMPKVGNLLVPFQFPMRFTVMMLSFGILLGAYVLKNLKFLVNDNVRVAITASTLLLAAIQFLSYSDLMLTVATPIKVTSHTGLDTQGAVIGAEYVIENTYTYLANEDEPTAEEGVLIRTYSNDDGIIRISVENKTGKESYVKIPKYAYRGYQAKDMATGYGMSLWHDYQNVMMVILPADYSGEIAISFESPIYWRIAEVISLMIVIVGIVIYLRDVRKRKAEKFSDE